MTTTVIIELNKLDADPRNIRKRYNPAKIAELAANIDAEGVRIPSKEANCRLVFKGEKRRLSMHNAKNLGIKGKATPANAKLA